MRAERLFSNPLVPRARRVKRSVEPVEKVYYYFFLGEKFDYL
jgi:hypothetical protein